MRNSLINSELKGLGFTNLAKNKNGSAVGAIL